jgi:hypothetical protein
MATALPLACYFGLNNQTFDLNIDERKWFLYRIVLKSMHINTVSVAKPTVFEQLPGTDKIHMKLDQVSIDLTLDGAIYAFTLIPIEAQKITLTGVSFDVVLESTSGDHVHWKLSATSKVQYQTLDI